MKCLLVMNISDFSLAEQQLLFLLLNNGKITIVLMILLRLQLHQK